MQARLADGPQGALRDLVGLEEVKAPVPVPVAMDVTAPLAEAERRAVAIAEVEELAGILGCHRRST